MSLIHPLSTARDSVPSPENPPNPTIKVRYTLTFASLVAAAFAADLSVIPSCAQGCISAAVAAKTSCAATDVRCTCASLETVTSEATPCVLEKCGLDIAVGKLPVTCTPF